MKSLDELITFLRQPQTPDVFPFNKYNKTFWKKRITNPGFKQRHTEEGHNRLTDRKHSDLWNLEITKPLPILLHTILLRELSFIYTDYTEIQQFIFC